MTTTNGSDLIAASVNYHGQQLRTLIDTHHIGLFHALELTNFDFQRYQSRARELAMQPRFQRLKLLDFIARNVDKLFVPVVGSAEINKYLPSPSCDSNELDTFDLPMLGEVMGVPRGEYRQQIASVLRKGDIVLTEVVGHRPNGMVMVAITAVLSLNCLVLPKTYHIHAHLLNTECFDKCKRVFNVQCFVLAVVNSISDNFSAFLSISNDDLPPHLARVFNLGIIGFDDLPLRCRIALTKDKTLKTFECYLHQSVAFKNPNVIFKIAKNIDIPMEKLTLSCNFSAEVTVYSLVDQLRRVQSSRWANYLVCKGVDFFKQGNLIEASQCLNQAINVDQMNVDALVARGALFANRGIYINAIEDFKLALNQSPYHSNAKRYMCDVLIAQVKLFEDKNNLSGVMEMFHLCKKYFPNDHPIISRVQGIITYLNGPIHGHTSSSSVDCPTGSVYGHMPRDSFPPPTSIISSASVNSSLGSSHFSNGHKLKSSQLYPISVTEGHYFDSSNTRTTDSDYDARVDRFLENVNSSKQRHVNYNMCCANDSLSSKFSNAQSTSHGRRDSFENDSNGMAISISGKCSNRDRRLSDRDLSLRFSTPPGNIAHSVSLSGELSHDRSRSPSGLLQRPSFFEEKQSKMYPKKFMIPSSAFTALDMQESHHQLKNSLLSSKVDSDLIGDDFLYGDSTFSGSFCDGSGERDLPNVYLKELQDLRDEIEHLKEKRDKRRKRKSHRSISPPQNTSLEYDKSVKDSRMLKVFEDYSTLSRSGVCSNSKEKKTDFKININSTNESRNIDFMAKESGTVHSSSDGGVNLHHHTENSSSFRANSPGNFLPTLQQRRRSDFSDRKGQTGGYLSNRTDDHDRSDVPVNISRGSISSERRYDRHRLRSGSAPRSRSIDHPKFTENCVSYMGSNRFYDGPDNYSAKFQRKSSSYRERYNRNWHRRERK